MKKAICISIVILSVIKCYSQNKSVITGKCLCNNNEITLSVLTDPVQFIQKYYSAEISKKDSTFKFTIPLSTSTSARLYNQQIYLTPNDSVHVSISEFGKPGIFHGMNSTHYNFFSDLLNFNQKQNQPNSPPFTVNSALEYKNHQVRLLNNQITFFNNYFINKSFTDDFKLMALHYIKSSYLSELLYPVYSSVRSRDLPESYLEELTYEELNRSELLVFREYILMQFQGISFLSDLQLNDLSNHNELLYQSIANHLIGQSQFAQKLFLLNSIVSRGKINNLGFAKNLYKEISNTTNSYKYDLTYLNDSWSAYDKLGKSFPAEVKSLLMTDISGKTISFNAFLNRHRNKTIYLDFWASWCGPCKEEMPASIKLDHDISKTKNVAFVYISIDKTKSNWQKGLEEIKVPGLHFNMAWKEAKTLMDYLNFNGIPRYIIITKTGTLYNYDAPRPSQTEKLIKEFDKIQ